MPRHEQRQPTQEPTRLVTQKGAADIIGVKRQNLGRWVPFLEAEEHGGRLFFTRASAERARDIRAQRQTRPTAPVSAVA